MHRRDPRDFERPRHGDGDRAAFNAAHWRSASAQSSHVRAVINRPTDDTRSLPADKALTERHRGKSLRSSVTTSATGSPTGRPRERIARDGIADADPRSEASPAVGRGARRQAARARRAAARPMPDRCSRAPTPQQVRPDTVDTGMLSGPSPSGPAIGPIQRRSPASASPQGRRRAESMLRLPAGPRQPATRNGGCRRPTPATARQSSEQPPSNQPHSAIERPAFRSPRRKHRSPSRRLRSPQSVFASSAEARPRNTRAPVIAQTDAAIAVQVRSSQARGPGGPRAGRGAASNAAAPSR